jgi:hypothetical protein
MTDFFIEFLSTVFVIFKFIEKFVNRELLVFFVFTRNKATSATAITILPPVYLPWSLPAKLYVATRVKGEDSREGAVEILGSLRRGHCCVCCRLWFRLELKADRF